MIEHKFPLDIEPRNLEPWLSAEDVTGITALPGWHNSVFRIDMRSGENLVLLRARKLDEFMYGAAETGSGTVKDWAYLRSSLTGWQQIQSLNQI